MRAAAAKAKAAAEAKAAAKAKADAKAAAEAKAKKEAEDKKKAEEAEALKKAAEKKRQDAVEAEAAKKVADAKAAAAAAVEDEVRRLQHGHGHAGHNDCSESGTMHCTLEPNSPYVDFVTWCNEGEDFPPLGLWSVPQKKPCADSPARTCGPSWEVTADTNDKAGLHMHFEEKVKFYTRCSASRDFGYTLS